MYLQMQILIIISLPPLQVKLTIMIEDPRDIERKRLLGIEDPDEVTRDDLAAALEDVCKFCMMHNFRSFINCNL